MGEVRPVAHQEAGLSGHAAGPDHRHAVPDRELGDLRPLGGEHRALVDLHGSRMPLGRGLESAIEVLGAMHGQHVEPEVERPGGGLRFLNGGTRDGGVSQEGHPREPREGLQEELQTLSSQLRPSEGHAGDVPSRPCQARRHAGRHRIARSHHHDGNPAGGPSRRLQRFHAPRHDDVRLEIDELAGQGWEPLDPPLGGPRLHHERLALDVPEGDERGHEDGGPGDPRAGQGPHAWNPRHRLRQGREGRRQEAPQGEEKRSAARRKAQGIPRGSHGGRHPTPPSGRG